MYSENSIIETILSIETTQYFPIITICVTNAQCFLHMLYGSFNSNFLHVGRTNPLKVISNPISFRFLVFIKKGRVDTLNDHTEWLHNFKYLTQTLIILGGGLFNNSEGNTNITYFGKINFPQHYSPVIHDVPI